MSSWPSSDQNSRSVHGSGANSSRSTGRSSATCHQRMRVSRVTEAALIGRRNSDLANGLGNLASRTLAMSKKWFEGAVQPIEPREPIDASALLARAATLLERLIEDPE